VTEPTPKPRRLSEVVASLSKLKDLTIGSLADALGERAFGALMFVFAIPNVIPTPPGTSAVLGLPLVILTFQLMMGRQTLWLPDTIRRRAIATSMIESFSRRMVPFLERIEKILKPRVSLIVRSDTAERFVGIVAFAMSVILFLPIPLVNILPAAAVACLALGLAERDGIFALLGYALAAATAALLTFVASALYVGAEAFLRAMFGG
jgi:hypothetical protein